MSTEAGEYVAPVNRRADATGARTYAVPAAGHPGVDEWVTESAYAAGWGLDIERGVALPPYLGVWRATNGGDYHLYSDYPASVHERFGWQPATDVTEAS